MPIKAAAISSLTWPSSGIPATRFAELVSAKPGTLSMISARSAKSRGFDFGGDSSLELGNLAGQTLQDVGMRFLNQSRRGMFAPAHQAHPKIDQIQARLHQRLQLLMCRIVCLARRLAECLSEPGDHLRVDRIVLGQPPC